MINEYRVKKFCNEDPQLIENYEKAISDKTKTWDCHHRLEELGFTKENLIYLGLYYKVPADELIFLTRQEHIDIHKKGRKRPKEVVEKMRKTRAERGSFAGSNNPMYGRTPWNKGKTIPLETRVRIRMKQLGVPKPKFKWLTPNGDIQIMDKRNVSRWHPDWKLIGPVD